MKAIVCSKYGPPEVLQFKEVRKPVPKNNEILIRVCAVFVGIEDIMQRKGKPYFGRIFVGFANGRVRFQDAEAVGKLHVKSVLPTQVTDVLDLRELAFGERHFGILKHSLHIRPSRCKSRISSRTLRSILGMSVGCIVSRFMRVINRSFLSNT